MTTLATLNVVLGATTTGFDKGLVSFVTGTARMASSAAQTATAFSSMAGTIEQAATRVTTSQKNIQSSLDKTAKAHSSLSSTAASTTSSAASSHQKMAKQVDDSANNIVSSNNKVQQSSSMTGAAYSRMARIVDFAIGNVIARAVTSLSSSVMDMVSSSAIGFNSLEEQSLIAFTTMSGSAIVARKEMDDLKNFAAKTPFTFPEVLTGAKQLQAYGEQVQDLIPDLNMLGNIAAGVGKDRLPFLILAFGQVQAIGHLAGQEMRQFAEAGVPILELLSNKLGKSKAQIQDMVEKGQISFKMVQDALRATSEEGGKFFDLMNKNSTTFTGALSNISDRINFLVGGGFKPLYDALTTGANALATFLASGAAQEWAQSFTTWIGHAITAVKMFYRDELPKILTAIQPITDFIRDNGMTALTLLVSGIKLVYQTFVLLITTMRSVGDYFSQHKTLAAALFVALMLVASIPLGAMFLASAAAVMSGIGVILGGIALIGNALLSLRIAFMLFGQGGMTTLIGMFSPAVVLGLAIGAIIAIVVLLATNFGGFRDVAIKGFALILIAAERLTTFLLDGVLWVVQKVATGVANLFKLIATGASYVPGMGAIAAGFASAANYVESLSADVAGYRVTLAGVAAQSEIDTTTIASGMLSVADAGHAAGDALSEMQKNDKLAEMLRKSRLEADALGNALAGPSNGGGVEGKAKKAKTALESLGISADNMRQAMDLLEFSSDEQRRVLIALGEEAIKAGVMLKGLNMTVDQLAAAFNLAGLNGKALAAQVQSIIAAKEAEKEAEKAQQEAKRAYEETTRAIEEQISKIKDLVGLIEGKLSTALETLVSVSMGQVGAGVSSAVGAVAGSLLGAGIGQTGRLTNAGGIAGGAAAAMAGDKQIPGTAEYEKAAGAVNGLTQKLADQAAMAQGAYADAWRAAAGVLGDWITTVVELSGKVDLAEASAKKVVDSLKVGYGSLEALARTGGNVGDGIGLITNTLDALEAKMPLLDAKQQAFAAATLKAGRALLEQAKNAGSDEEKLKAIASAYAMLGPAFAQIADDIDGQIEKWKKYGETLDKFNKDEAARRAAESIERSKEMSGAWLDNKKGEVVKSIMDTKRAHDAVVTASLDATGAAFGLAAGTLKNVEAVNQLAEAQARMSEERKRQFEEEEQRMEKLRGGSAMITAIQQEMDMMQFNGQRLTPFTALSLVGKQIAGSTQAVTETGGLVDVNSPYANAARLGAIEAAKHFGVPIGLLHSSGGYYSLRGGFGPMSAEDDQGSFGYEDMHAFAGGGIALNEMVARVGEGNKPEAIMPLDQLPGIMASAMRQSGGGAGGGDVVLMVDSYELARSMRTPIQHGVHRARVGG